MELSILLLMCVFAVAFVIGATAIGGLLLVPVIVILGGYPIHAAIPASLLSIFFSGVVGSLIFGGSGHVRIGNFVAAAAPAGALAFLCALVMPGIPALYIELFVVILCLWAFWSSLRTVARVEAQREPGLSPAKMAGIGAVTGIGSTLSGTGGPLILIPILTLLGFESRRTVGLAQAIQLPIGGSAALGSLAVGSINFGLAGPMVGVVVLGTACGALFAQRINATVLKRLVSFMILFSGVIYLTRLLMTFTNT